MDKKLEKIEQKYSSLAYNDDNYSIGGGLARSGKKASNRHEDALADEGKKTFGQVAQMFKRATGRELRFVKEVINYAVPNMEWHHAGFLPKKYGGGMKKTYFLNANEIADIAANWESYIEKIEISKNEKRVKEEIAKNSEAAKLAFLNKYATKIERIKEIPSFFYETNREMNGKYGWFSSYGKMYNMIEYYTGWEFYSEEKLEEFYKL